MSTGGAAMKAIMNTEVAVKRVGIMITPNQPMYKRFSVLVIHSQKRAQRLVVSRRSRIAVIVFKFNNKINFLRKTLVISNFNSKAIKIFFLINKVLNQASSLKPGNIIISN